MNKKVIVSALCTSGLISLLLLFFGASASSESYALTESDHEHQFAQTSCVVNNFNNHNYLPIVVSGGGNGSSSTPNAAPTIIFCTPTPSITPTSSPTPTPTPTAEPIPIEADIVANPRSVDGTLGIFHQSIYGSGSCTLFGDPFSPTNSSWVDNFFEPYAYQYRIYIPPTYEDDAGTDLVRVELFDPDSINRAGDTVQIQYTDFFTNNAGLVDNSRTENCQNYLSYASSYHGQRSECVIPTCEWDEASQNYSCDNLSLSGYSDSGMINPYWFERVDQNRAYCSLPSSYITNYHTMTRYELYYYRETNDGTPEKVSLASYTSQVGNDFTDLDDYSHGTDLHWVSPGAPNPYVPVDLNSDESAGFVPTDCGSLNGGSQNTAEDRCADGDVGVGVGNGFEVQLGIDTPDMVEDSGRYLYLDVTAFTGSSKNGYEIYAGPPDLDPETGERLPIPSEVNARNLWIANQRYHGNYDRSSQGIIVSALDVQPIVMIDVLENPTVRPLIYIPADHAGHEVTISLFDSDSWSGDSFTYYFDTIPRDDFEVAYTGVTCDGYACNGQWFGPPGSGDAAEGFVIQVPTYDPLLCTDSNDPDLQHVCTPFSGGTLYVAYYPGEFDMMTWQITMPDFSE